MIRDPIARFESFYYFSRFGNNLGGGGHAKLDEAQKQETIDECVQKKRFCCKSPWWQVVPYLCGQDPRCSEKSEESRKWAVERAKVILNAFFWGRFVEWRFFIQNMSVEGGFGSQSSK